MARGRKLPSSLELRFIHRNSFPSSAALVLRHPWVFEPPPHLSSFFYIPHHSPTTSSKPSSLTSNTRLGTSCLGTSYLSTSTLVYPTISLLPSASYLQPPPTIIGFHLHLPLNHYIHRQNIVRLLPFNRRSQSESIGFEQVLYHTSTSLSHRPFFDSSGMLTMWVRRLSHNYTIFQ